MNNPIIPEDTFDKLIKFFNLEHEQKQKLKIFLKAAKVQKLMIRDILSQEGKSTRKAFYLLQGQVNITTKLINGEKVTLYEIGKEQLLNFQIILTNWINKYSIVVSSSFINFITFEEKDIKMFTTHLHKQLTDKITIRQKDVIKRNKKVREEQRKKKMQDNINKLILPEINFVGNRKKSFTNIASQYTQHISSIKNLPNFSKQTLKSSKSSSLKMKSRYSQPHNLDKKSLQAENQYILEHLHEYKSKFLQHKLQRLKSQKSFTSNEKEVKQIDYSRNEKLFKEQLKSIVKRKLLFERKHFKILSEFKNDPKKATQQEGLGRRYEEDENPIDNYFIL